MIRAQIDTALARLDEKPHLSGRGDETPGATAGLRITPAQDTRLIATCHLGRGADATADGNDGMSGLQHGSQNMLLTHNVKHAIRELDDSERNPHYPRMRFSDITPEWIAAKRDALGLKNVDIYTAIGMPQDRFSKSMHGRRGFTPAELDAIVDFFSSKEAVVRVPVLTEIVEKFPRLSEHQQALVASLVEDLWRSTQGTHRPDDGSPEDG